MTHPDTTKSTTTGSSEDAAVPTRDAEGLVARGLSVRYGGVIANDNIDLSVAPGQIVGLIGPNGAGKTTFVDAVSGFTKYSGEVTLDGTSLDGVPAHLRRRRGLSRTWQSGELFGNLTVAQNVAVAESRAGISGVVRDLVMSRSSTASPSVERALAAVGLDPIADRLARDLPLGQQKLVGVARAMVGECSLLLLDEPAAGLDSEESARFAERVRAIASGGPGVLLIDHDMSLVLDVCEVLYVFEFGRLIFSGPTQDALNDERVIAAYLGAPMEATDA